MNDADRRKIIEAGDVLIGFGALITAGAVATGIVMLFFAPGIAFIAFFCVIPGLLLSCTGYLKLIATTLSVSTLASNKERAEE